MVNAFPEEWKSSIEPVLGPDIHTRAEYFETDQAAVCIDSYGKRTRKSRGLSKVDKNEGCRRRETKNRSKVRLGDV